MYYSIYEGKDQNLISQRGKKQRESQDNSPQKNFFKIEWEIMYSFLIIHIVFFIVINLLNYFDYQKCYYKNLVSVQFHHKTRLSKFFLHIIHQSLYR